MAGRHSSGQDSRGWKLRDRIFTGKHEAESKLEAGLSDEISGPIPVTYFFQQRRLHVLNLPKQRPPTGDQVFIPLRLWKSFVLQPPFMVKVLVQNKGRRRPTTQIKDHQAAGPASSCHAAFSSMLEETHIEGATCCIQPDSHANFLQLAPSRMQPE